MKTWHITVLAALGVALFTVLLILGISLAPEKVAYKCRNVTQVTFECTRKG